MPPDRAHLGELAADLSAQTGHPLRGVGQITDVQVDVRRHTRLPRRDLLKGQPSATALAEDRVRRGVERDRLAGQLAVEPDETVGSMATDRDVGKARLLAHAAIVAPTAADGNVRRLIVTWVTIRRQARLRAFVGVAVLRVAAGEAGLFGGAGLRAVVGFPAGPLPAAGPPALRFP